jgi:hypothetical protein
MLDWQVLLEITHIHNSTEYGQNFLMIFVDTWGQSYKAIYAREIRIFVVGESFCPWQSFPA